MLATLVGFEGDVFTLAFSPDSSTLVTGGGGTASLRPNDIVGSFATELMNMAKNVIGANKQGGEVVVWDIASGRRLRSLVGHSVTVTAVAFTPDGGALATGSQDGSVGIWDADTGKARVTFRAAGSKRASPPWPSPPPPMSSRRPRPQDGTAVALLRHHDGPGAVWGSARGWSARPDPGSSRTAETSAWAATVWWV